MPLRERGADALSVSYVYLVVLLAAAILAFWPGYLRDLPSAPFEFHAHGITASLWILLLIAQTWTIHHGGREMHRLVGRLSLLLFPLFLAGAAIVGGVAVAFAGWRAGTRMGSRELAT